MAKTVFLDTGPLVALFRERDQFHQWVKIELSKDDYRFITCEAVLTETLFLTQNLPKVLDSISGMIESGMMVVRSALVSNPKAVFEKLNKYNDQKTSLADISLLVLYEEQKDSAIFTTDSDFLIYRDSQGKKLNLISPYLK
ncbi:MAG: PIN domain-containing protein [Balneola sp.]|nr:PIN domain-containing protein [Balneola sp.]MBO6650456.1 PIN domain-containing protein [Balneola sp.]MBO6710148.1 PIN domain-containing protein [Balneola sp.]MBO6798832.1 PIN domain-containing protein [Balneola sp.]MBO6869946.1 PIN domain-containing protein [Balneola sp.]